MLRFIHSRTLAWISIVGLAITVVGSLDPVLQIAGFIRFLAEHWREFSGVVWNSIFGIFGIHANTATLALLNAGCFVLALEIAVTTAPHRPFSVWSVLLKLLNGVIVAALFVLIAVGSISGHHAPGDQMPNPAEWSSWLDRKNWLPLAVYVFAFTGLPIGATAEPFAMARRLVDVILFLLVILGFNYIAIYGPAVTDWLGQFSSHNVH
jgi:hypothetical protein